MGVGPPSIAFVLTGEDPDTTADITETYLDDEVVSSSLFASNLMIATQAPGVHSDPLGEAPDIDQSKKPFFGFSDAPSQNYVIHDQNEFFPSITSIIGTESVEKSILANQSVTHTAGPYSYSLRRYIVGSDSDAWTIFSFRASEGGHEDRLNPEPDVGRSRESLVYLSSGGLPLLGSNYDDST